MGERDFSRSPIRAEWPLIKKKLCCTLPSFYRTKRAVPVRNDIKSPTPHTRGEVGED